LAPVERIRKPVLSEGGQEVQAKHCSAALGTGSTEGPSWGVNHAEERQRGAQGESHHHGVTAGKINRGERSKGKKSNLAKGR